MLKKIMDWFRWRKARRFVRHGASPLSAAIEAGLLSTGCPGANHEWFLEEHPERIGDWELIGIDFSGTNVWANHGSYVLFVGDRPDA